MLGDRARRGRRTSVGVVALVAALALAGQAAGAGPAGAGPGTGHDTRAERPVPAAPRQLVIDTVGATSVTSKDDYVAGTMQLDGLTHALEIKGRGNSTWGWPKKPYKLKLAEDASLLGMTAETDEWVLLANYADRSALRTQVAFDLASRTRLAWTPETRYVDVVLNGQPLGLYLLTEQVEQGSDRVDLPDDGFLLEVDKRFRRSGDQGFRTGRGVPVAFKDPDEVTRKERRLVKRAVRHFENVLYGPDFADRERGYRSLVDVGSFVDWYLVEELLANQDSNFQSSVNFSWVPGGKIEMGPVWDFDLSAGSRWSGAFGTVGYHTRTGGHWISRMLEDPAFSAAVERRWAALRPAVTKVVSRIPASAAAIRPSALTDWSQWHASGDQPRGSVHADSFDGEVAFLARWLEQRAEWLDLPEVAFARTGVTVPEQPSVVRVPVRLTAPATRRVTVDYAWAGGSATSGRDFRLAPGRLVFRPGQTTKFVEVHIRQDRRRERAEHIDLVLSGGQGPAVLGSPSTLRLWVARSD
jgi:hypothetical protein